MTTFEIAPNPGGGYTAKIDGIDLSRYIRANGVRVEFIDDRAVVTITLIPVQLRGDLPNAVVRLVENDYDDKLADWEKEVLLRQVSRPIVDTEPPTRVELHPEDNLPGHAVVGMTVTDDYAKRINALLDWIARLEETCRWCSHPESVHGVQNEEHVEHCAACRDSGFGRLSRHPHIRMWCEARP